MTCLRFQAPANFPRFITLRRISTSSVPASSASAAAPGGRREETDLGFRRPEFRREKLAGTVQLYDRHVFLCHGSHDTWTANVEAHVGLPATLAKAIKDRKEEMKKKTRLTVCTGEDAIGSSNGDVLIFPDMVRYRKLTEFDVNSFVERILVQEETKLNSVYPEKLAGSYIFVCSHVNRDSRCGFCGPILVQKFKQQIDKLGLLNQVFVSPCSHIGGHKYAGNVIIFSPNLNGEMTGHWYGYVSPDDVPVLLEQHIGKHTIVDKIWRGEMGLSQEDQKKAHKLRIQV